MWANVVSDSSNLEFFSALKKIRKFIIQTIEIWSLEFISLNINVFIALKRIF
jgi:hypothetical protein